MSLQPNSLGVGPRPDDTHHDRVRRTTQVKDHPFAGGPPRSVAGLLRVLNEMQFFTPEELTALAAPLTLEQKREPPEPFLKRLVAEGRLTSFQAEVLFKGEGPPLVFGDYLVIDQLGAGGMGTVYRARDRHNGHIFALKVVGERDDRFDLEIRAAAKVHHPNVVQVYDRGHLANYEYLVMECVDGPVLSDYVREKGRLPVAEAVDYIRQVAEALDHVHLQRIVHRDLKPHNLLRDPSGRIKMLDFGLARFDHRASSFSHDGKTEEERLTAPGTILGTPSFSAPEQIKDAATASYMADLYSLGCTLHYLLTGSAPYTHFNPMKIVEAHLNDPIPSLRDSRSDVSPALDAVFRKLMAKDPAERYQSAEELLAALNNPAVLANPLLEAEHKPPQRKRGASWALIGSLVLLALGVGAGVAMVAGQCDLAWLQLLGRA